MEQKQRDSTSSQKQEVVIISPEELKKLGITKNLILAHNSQENTVVFSSPESTPTTTPTSSPNSKSNIKTSPIVLNAQVSRNYMKAVYGTAGPPAPRLATLAKKSFPQPATITLSPARKLVPNKPDILNSKVCLPIRKVISTEIAKSKTESANVAVEKKPELEVANVLSDDEVIDLDSSREDGPPSTVKDIEKFHESMKLSHSDGELIMSTLSRIDERQPKKLINVISVASVQLPQHTIRHLVKSSNANDSDKCITIQKQIDRESETCLVEKIRSSTVPVEPNLVYGETKNLSESMTKEDSVSSKPSINDIVKTLNEGISETSLNKSNNSAAVGEKTIFYEQVLPDEKLHEDKDESSPLKEVLLEPSMDDEVIILDPEVPIEPKLEIVHAISSSGKDTNIPQVIKPKAKTRRQPLAVPIPASRTYKTFRVYTKKSTRNPSENMKHKNKSLKTVKVEAVKNDQIPLNVTILKTFKSVDKQSEISCNKRSATVVKDIIEIDTESLEINDNVIENTRSNNNEYFPGKDSIDTTTSSEANPKGKKRAGRSRKTPLVANQTVEVEESLFDQSKSEDIKCIELDMSIETPVKKKRASAKSNLDQPVAAPESAIIEDGDLNNTKGKSRISRIPRKATRVSYLEDEDDGLPGPKSKGGKPKKKFEQKNFQDESTVYVETKNVDNVPVHGENEYEKQSASGKDKIIKVKNQKTDGLVNPDMETSSKTPKKRGRPKKQAEEPKVKESLLKVKESLVKVEELPVDLESSKSGRKRKRVDYFAMENSFYEMEYSNMNNKRYDYKGLSGQKKGEKEFVPKETPRKGRRGRKPKSEKIDMEDFDETVSPSRRKNEMSVKVRSEKGEGINGSSKGDTVEGESSLVDLSDSVISDVQNTNESVVGILEELREGKTDIGDVEVSGSKENKSGSQTAKGADNIEHGIEDSELEQTLENSTAIDDSLSSADKSEKKRYSKTGQTAAMVQNVFMAAMKTFCDSDEEGDGAKKPQQQSWTIPKVKPRIGRPPKRGYNSSLHSLDKIDEATCVTCHETISMEDWTDHNIYEHYNLSWHSAEQPLDLEDIKIKQKRLKVALKVLNQLKCRICSENFTVVSDYMNHIEECSGVVTNGKVKCVICKVEIDKNEWLKHKLKMHNNLAWRKGDLPLELDNQQQVMDILKSVLKQKKQLYCYRCHTSKKSIVGYLSHQAQCGQKEAKVECNICGRRMLPVSVLTHMKMHNEKSNISSPKSHLKQDVIMGEIKRRAAQKALTVISAFSKDMVRQDSSNHYIKQEVFQVEDFFRNILAEQLSENGTIKCKHKGCDYEDGEVDSLLDHLTQCKKKPESSYVCKNCLLITSDEEEMREHVLLYLQDDQPEYVADELELEDVIYQEILKKRKIDETRLEKFPNFKAKPTFLLLNGPKRRKELYVCAFEYTLEFCNEHFTLSELFPSFHYKKSDWQLVEEKEMETYLPKNDCSCQVARISLKQYYNNPNTDYACKTYELFEVQQDGLFQAIFCGGPVHAMAWLPTPHMYLECDQVLAVAVANTFEAKYKMNMNYTEPSSIQFWHFGILKNKSLIPKAQLMFCLAVDIGPVWHLEWCPSGCYSQKKAVNDNMNRMGLLAVAGSVPTVQIYAIPFLDENDRELIYKVKPVLKLQLSQDEENPSQKYFPSRISWSKASGHKYIAVGYTNGMVGIFNLNCESNLLRFKGKQDKVDIILPYKTIKAHKSRITVLSMIHLKGGSTWLLTGSYDKRVCTWNLDDNTNVAYSNKKIPYDGTWMTNWIVHVTAPDSFSSAVLTLPSSIKSHRDYLSDSTGVLQSNSSVMSISTSDWLNGMIQGNATGDIVGCFPSQLVCSFDNEKMGDLRHVLGCTKLVSKPEVEGLQNRMDKNNIMDYQWSTQRYKLVFCDLEMNRYSEAYKQLAAKIKARNENWDEVAKQMDLYPVVSVNKICFNPNCQASLYYATGYQAGFVRLSYLKFLENDRQVV